VKRAPQLAKLQLERARARFGVIDIAVRTFKRYSEDDGGPNAAALTYYAFFSIFPLLLFAAAILGYMTFASPELRAQILESAVNSVPLVREALDPENLTLIENRRQALAITGAALALYAGSGAIVALEHALNKIHRTTVEPNWVGKRVRSLKFLAVFGGAAVLSVALGTVASSAPSGVAAVLALLGGLAVNVFIFSAAYKYLPNATQSWTAVLPGAIVAGIVFELLKLFGAAYLAGGQGARDATFGALASAATLLVASYLISQVVLLAAEINAVLCERREMRTTS
jgi:YihY family inner membrane protein